MDVDVHAVFMLRFYVEVEEHFTTPVPLILPPL